MLWRMKLPAALSRRSEMRMCLGRAIPPRVLPVKNDGQLLLRTPQDRMAMTVKTTVKVTMKPSRDSVSSATTETT